MADKDVFISYKAEETEEAAWVKSVLESNGISCWMAPSCIPGGSSYAVEIPQAIRNARGACFYVYIDAVLFAAAAVRCFRGYSIVNSVSLFLILSFTVNLYFLKQFIYQAFSNIG